MLGVPVYTLLAMRRVYGGRWAALLARAVALSLAYAMLIGVLVATGALVALLW
jgi:hypothetical protein